MFRKNRKKGLSITYDRVLEKPVLWCSICTGEQVAGFRDIHTVMNKLIVERIRI